MDPITFEGGPITHQERVELLQSINQYVPRRRPATKGNDSSDDTDCEQSNKKGKARGRPLGAKNIGIIIINNSCDSEFKNNYQPVRR